MSTPDRRWPRRVYGVGTEPDPRFSLANERTFLAWIRTTLALLAGAAAIDALALPMPRLAQQGIAVLLAVAGIASAIQAFVGWAAAERAMRLGRPLPGNAAGLPLVTIVIVVAVIVVVTTVTRA